ncbi:hypothetical protein GCM10022631_04860 [Deinococcus rubellus]|uniref:Recombinase family protein n=1 Tax=Deinococcus rubellus TaxID=1889240 RepID=A0ABY5YJ57_9DEIO|nr:recombinase family protein [Deinococcus rubellus]UWX64161.1 recombinase family protein [Deinococcus rubellus]
MIPYQTASLSILDPRISVVGGIRVSTDQQADQYGPDRQRADVERDAERNGLSIVHWVEESISGANHDRAAENEYYALARRFHGLNFMFSHPNRVGRHVEVIVGIARQIHQLGGTVWIAGLGNLRDGRNWRYFLRNAAEAETDYLNVVDQLYRGKRGKALRGKWPHGAPPWGYVLERDEKGRSTRPVPNPVTAPVVKRVADLAETVGGESKSLAVILEEGCPAPTAAGWSIRSIHNILKNERYTGRAVFGGIELLFEPIIPREQFERIQKLRAARRRESGPKDTGMLLAGFTRCAECGAAIGRGSSLTPYARYLYYCCWKSKRPRVARKDGGCTNTKNWQPPVLDGLCWDALVRHLTRPA